MTLSDYVPRQYHDQQVTALTDRCIAAERCIVDLLTEVAPDALERHAGDWLAAVRELTA